MDSRCKWKEKVRSSGVKRQWKVGLQSPLESGACEFLAQFLPAPFLVIVRQPGRFQDSVQVEMMEEDFIQKIKELKCCLVGGVGEQ
ncbi:hypothetical protein CK203_029092 [Vitis vinifera]|uniref:Uncharacterized protein n=1 Tax=Vitis vinifera TaxID=29760 RepID=A0A438IMV0_VITVI|nr:hypothetical protein CK203_029092 [Vitis vinifera]